MRTQYFLFSNMYGYAINIYGISCMFFYLRGVYYSHSGFMVPCMRTDKAQ